jgi:hypothetical protein
MTKEQGDVAMRAGTTRWIWTVCGLAYLACMVAAPPAGAFVYWANVNVTKAVGRANLDGSGANQSFIPDTPSHDPCGVAVDASHVYWATHSFFNPSYTLDSTIGRASLDGSGANQSFITGAFGPCGVAVDSAHVYWANEGIPFGQPGGTIGRANLDGSGVNQKFIRGASAPCGVAVDSGHVYWANSDFPPSSIGRANLDGSGANENFISANANPNGVAVDALEGLPSGRLSRFQFGKLKRNLKRGTAILVVHVFGPGKLVLSGPKIQLAKGAAASAGNVSLKVMPKRAAKLDLRRHHRLRTSVKVRFLPTGGSPTTKAEQVVLVLNP